MPNFNTKVRKFTITAVKTPRRYGEKQFSPIHELRVPNEAQGGPTIVLGRFDDGQEIYFAKIYDGLFYNYDVKWKREGFYYYEHPRTEYSAETGRDDYMTKADSEYATEARAFHDMNKTFGGAVVSKYWGSWTFPLDSHVLSEDDPMKYRTELDGSISERWVRMCIFDNVQGQTVADRIREATTPQEGRDSDNSKKGRGIISYAELPDEEERLRIYKQVLEAKLAVWLEGEVHHPGGSFDPQNVLVKDDGSGIVLADFTQAHIDGWACSSRHLNREHKVSNGSGSRRSGTNPAANRSPVELFWPYALEFLNCSQSPLHWDLTAWNSWLLDSWQRSRGDSFNQMRANWLLNTWRSDPRYPPHDAFLTDTFHSEFGREVLRRLVALGRRPESSAPRSDIQVEVLFFAFEWPTGIPSEESST